MTECSLDSSCVSRDPPYLPNKVSRAVSGVEDLLWQVQTAHSSSSPSLNTFFTTTREVPVILGSLGVLLVRP